MRLVLAVSFIVFLCLAIFHKYSSRKTSHGRPEPPIVPAKIPFFGHVIGMITHKKEYYKRLRDKCNLPIITLPLPAGRVYIVFHIPTIQSVQKQHKTLAFQPIQAKFSVKLCGASKDAMRILDKDMDPENGHYGSIYVSMHDSLNPGQTLNQLNRVTMERLNESINRLSPGPGQTKHIKLVEWLRHHVTLATTEAVYGPHNPFRNREVERSFWIFEKEIPKLIFLPNWLAPYGARHRKFVADAFKTYFTNNHHSQASGLVKDFYASEVSYGFSLQDRCMFEVGHALAILANTSGAVFWMIFYVFSNPDALRDIRAEVSTIITTAVDNSGKKTHHLDMTKVNANCPMLVSTFREAMRLHSIGISLRQVCKDTIIDDTYHLRKDAMVMMPTVAIHSDPRIWGSDVKSFDHKRFLPSSQAAKNNKISPAAFRSFGGGTTLCPGRHFATTQIMAWTMMFVMRFELSPADERGWVEPTTDKTNLANVTAAPDHDVEAVMERRREFEEGEWTFQLTDKEALFNVTVEDLDEKGKE